MGPSMGSSSRSTDDYEYSYEKSKTYKKPRKKKTKKDGQYRGKVGQISKIREEYEELIQASENGFKVLEQVELIDLIGACFLYAKGKMKMSEEQILQEVRRVNRKR